MKMKFVSRVMAAALTLAMLLPCVMTAPISAAEETKDPAMYTIWSYTPKHNDAAREQFINQQFPSNIRMEYSAKSSNYNYSYYYVRSKDFYTPEGPRVFMAQEMAGGFRPAVWSGSMNSNTAVNGVPYRLTDGGQIKMLENLKFELGAVEYPIVTRGMGALNIAFDYLAGDGVQGNLWSEDEMRVFVSLDGETYLPDGVGIRSHKLIGGGRTDRARSKGNVVGFHLETENLLDIPGLPENARIQRIKIHMADDDSTYAKGINLGALELNAYNTKADFERLVPKKERPFLHVGEDVMRQIVIDEGERFASVEWTTDYTVHTITGKNNMPHHPGYLYKGAVYTQLGDSSREWLEANIKDGKWIGGYGQDNSAGTDCQNFVFNCVSRVSPAMGWACQYTAGQPGLVLLGKDFLHIPDGVLYHTDLDCVEVNSQQDIFKSYALAKPGDQSLAYGPKAPGHVRVVASNHTVYNADGTIDGKNSYIQHTEQAMYPYYNILLADGTETRVSAAGANGWDEVQEYVAKNPGSKILYGHASMSGRSPNSGKHTYENLWKNYYTIHTNKYYLEGNIMLEDVEILLCPKSTTEPIEKSGVSIAFSSNYIYVSYDVLLEDLSTGEKLFDYKYIFNEQNDAARGVYSNDQLDGILKGLTNGKYRLSFTLHSGPFTAIGQSKVPATTESYEFTITDNAPADQVTVSGPASATKGQTVEVLVNSANAIDAADVDVKFDTEALTFVKAQQTDNVFARSNGGIVAIKAADAGVTAGGTLTKLTFTAKKDIAKLDDVVRVKSATVSTAEGAVNNGVKAIAGTDASATINFGDVHENAWYHDAVGYAVENGVMSGYNAATFGPNDKLSRAMVVQVLYNHENKPVESSENKFPDVKAEDWYFNATRWGAAKGVVSGYGNGTFAPNNNVTVEEIAVILHNYSGKPSGSGGLAGVGKYDDWAAGALQWAVANGVLKNVPFTNATETATRAQTAQMLMNYLSK